MHFGILLILTYATLTLAVPFPNPLPIAFLANHVTTVRDEALNLPVSDRQVGLNFFPCENDEICVGDRRCLTVIVDGFQPCTTKCFCFPPDVVDLVCLSESDCDVGESCVSLRNEPDPTVCVSDAIIPDISDDPPVTGGPTTAPTSSIPVTQAPTTKTNTEPPATQAPTTTTTTSSSTVTVVTDPVDDNSDSDASGDQSEAVCIGVDSLGHLSREQLVFETDAVAHVLCDFNESCATPGHMVQYKGNGMMMRSYCELVGCVRRVMRVNSPKYMRGLTVSSKTEDLVFTALAARFESRVEEGVLSVAVRFGF